MWGLGRVRCRDPRTRLQFESAADVRVGGVCCERGEPRRRVMRGEGGRGGGTRRNMSRSRFVILGYFAALPHRFLSHCQQH